VGYSYDIGKFEVSEDMIDKFNASQSFQIIKGSTRGPIMPARWYFLERVGPVRQLAQYEHGLPAGV
jgi:hypothetical protein